jgi:hypothetical protein
MKLAIPVYLANAYSSKLKDEDSAAFQRANRRLLESYVGGVLKKRHEGKYCFLLPIALSGSMADLCKFGTGFDTWVKDDYTWISICQQVWVLTSDGWKESQGVQAEIKFARRMGKVVRYLHPETLEFIKEIEALNLLTY